MELYHTDDPARALSLQSASLPIRVGARAFFILRFDLVQNYLPDNPSLPLAAVCELVRDHERVSVRACVSERVDQLQALANLEDIDAIAKRMALAVLDFSAPWQLLPVNIAKPWGQEIWYTGIEARGLSHVVSDTGSTPLPWALAMNPKVILGDQKQPILLKILDPLPDAVYGDLYFELHEKKREVYIVTHIDQTAWPNGDGAIRFGFSQTKLAQYRSNDGFLIDYREAVKKYQQTRQEIDAKIDVLRARSGIALHAPVTAQQMETWLADIPSTLKLREHELRTEMDSYSTIKTLRVGDVLSVPCFTPHALQHGVRVVEFQTPTYERKILSFAQKVLTQTHWDTDAALTLVHMQTPVPPPFPILLSAGGVQIEQIVAFSDFEVLRCFIAPTCGYELPNCNFYQIVMTVIGEVCCANILLKAEQASLIQAHSERITLRNNTHEQAVVLIAKPV